MFAGRERAAEPWAGPLEVAREVARALHERRDSLEVGAPEPVFEFDSEGHVDGVRHEEQTESHSMIEALMVLANEQVAGYLEDRRLPPSTGCTSGPSRARWSSWRTSWPASTSPRRRCRRT